MLCHMEDVSRLPKWAQHRIFKLEADLKSERAREHRATVIGGSLVSQERIKAPGPSVILEPYGEQPTLLHEKTHVAFKLGEGWDTEIRVCIKNGALDINGGRSLTIQPRSSNSLEIGTGQ